MKKFLSLISTLLATFCIFIAATACGNTARAYKPLYDYLQSEGGSDKTEGLADPTLGVFNIELSADEGEIVATFTWKNNISDQLSITFYETDNQHVDIHYTVISVSPIMIVGLDASCTNLEDLSTLTIQTIYYTTEDGTTALKDSDPTYTQMKQKADKYLPQMVKWLSTDVSVLLDDETLSVQDLYDPS